MFADGEIHASEQVVRDYLLTHGDHIEGLRLLAQIGMKLDAVGQKHVHARKQMEMLLKADPHNRIYRSTLATIHAGYGDHTRTLALCGELLGETPHDPELRLSVAYTLKTLGRTEEAIASYRAAAADRAHFGAAYWGLANLKTYRFTEAEIARMRAALTCAHIQPVDRYHLCFAGARSGPSDSGLPSNVGRTRSARFRAPR
jgi:predicted Zn-dependent protease